jgi:hypothetical protein
VNFAPSDGKLLTDTRGWRLPLCRRRPEP